MKNRTGWILGAAWAGMLFCLSPAAAAEEVSCTTMVKTTCTRCHSETRICQKVQKDKGKGAWKRTVKRMISHGAVAGEDEKTRLITCLSTPDPAIREFCTK
jgi:hypothetical protein